MSQVVCFFTLHNNHALDKNVFLETTCFLLSLRVIVRKLTDLLISSWSNHVHMIEALPGVLGIQGEGLRVIYFQGFGEKA